MPVKILLIGCLLVWCAGCEKQGKGRTRRHEPQPVMLRDNPAPRPAEVKQAPQPTPAPQRAPQPVQMAPVGNPVEYTHSEPGVDYLTERDLERK